MFVATHTLGCKVNQCDTDTLVSRLKTMGFGVRHFSERADIYIINTCTVTHVSDKKSRQMIRRARKTNPDAFIAVCGCMAKNKAVPGDIADVDFIFDAREPNDFFVRVQTFLNTLITTDEFLHQPIFDATERRHGLIDENLTRTRAFVKIQDGCNRFCSYCIVPYVRGDLNSRPATEILDEASKLISRGVLEIVLTGIQVASYGDDKRDTNLTELITQAARLDGLQRLRLSSIDPWAVNADFLRAVKNSPVLCDHFHLSLQSGCDATLARMNRRYTTTEYRAVAIALRKLRPECALTTDIIVGFPGETDADFQTSLDFVKEIGFAQLHVFEFSPREGTPAIDFDGQVPQNVKSERGVIMRETAAKLRVDFLRQQTGKTVPVLFETAARGHTTNYCPVEISTEKILTNTIANVKITACTETSLTGNLI